MQLRIIDNFCSETYQSGLEIIFLADDQHIAFNIESYTSPISENYQKIIRTHFMEAAQGKEVEPKGDFIAEKLIKFGQLMGDELLGEDHQFVKVKEIIELKGYNNLSVKIESSRPEFFNELWETLILPDSTYVLSGAAKEFIRVFSGEKIPAEYAEQSLNVNPLHILHLVSRPEGFFTFVEASNAINLSLTASAALDIEVHQTTDWTAIQSRMNDTIRPFHIFHYDGPIAFENDNIYFLMNNSLIPLNEIVSVMVASKIGALSVDARVYLKNGQPITAALGLATVANRAQELGLGNVIGLGQITSPWVSQQCFEKLYAELTKGHGLSQAVVEARKALQSHAELTLFDPKPTVFYPWSLLVHYSKQSIAFFKSDQNPAAETLPDEFAFFQGKLFGFRSEMLPPLLDQIGDGQALSVIDHAVTNFTTDQPKAISIFGAEGKGKTQLTHLVSLCLIKRKVIDFGFYFNFSNEDYSSKEILQMIAPIIKSDLDDLNKIESKLNHLRCCFVFDDLVTSDNLINSDADNNCFSESFSEFIKKLVKSGHLVIFVGQSLPSTTIPSLHVKVKSLLPVERKMLAVSVIKALSLESNKLDEIIKDNRIDSFLASLKSNPWLIRKVIALLPYYDLDNLNSLVREEVIEKSTGSLVDSFYEWRWSLLNAAQQKLIALCSLTPGLLLEMLMIAADKNDKLSSPVPLFEFLGEPTMAFSISLNDFDAAGFLMSFPHGRMIDQRCLVFLSEKEKLLFSDIEKKQAQFYFSQLVCEGISVLTQHLLKQSNPSVFNNLILNRRHLVKHFECLWFEQDFRGFMNVKQAFDQLLRQANLESESRLWIQDLLSRSPVPTTANEASVDSQLSWLALAASALDVKDTPSEKIQEGVWIWQSWFSSQAENLPDDQLPLFQQVAIFLEKFYQQESNWIMCLDVCRQTVPVYKRHLAYHRLIHAFKASARYHVELGQKNQALEYENKIVDEIPYADAPPGFKAKQLLEIVVSRLSRNEAELAQNMLDLLKTTENTQSLDSMIEGLQSDIDYQRGNYELALPYLSKIWVKATQAGHELQIAQVKSRLLELHSKLGEEQFNSIFEQEVPQGTVKPTELLHLTH